MNRRRVDGKSTKGTSVSGSAAITIVGERICSISVNFSQDVRLWINIIQLKSPFPYSRMGAKSGTSAMLFINMRLTAQLCNYFYVLNRTAQEILSEKVHYYLLLLFWCVGGGTSKSLSSSSWRLEQKDKREREEVVVAALSVLSNATNKHLLQQHDTQNAARAIALNLEASHIHTHTSVPPSLAIFHMQGVLKL